MRHHTVVKQNETLKRLIAKCHEMVKQSDNTLASVRRYIEAHRR